AKEAKDAKADRPYLQGWAVVENTTDEDWNGVRMALISGRPISFQMNLYDALFIKRPVVEPELFASLRPPSYSGGLTAPDDRLAAPMKPGTPDLESAKKDGKGGGRYRGEGRSNQLGAGFGGRAGASREVLKELNEKMDLGQSVASAASASK